MASVDEIDLETLTLKAPGISLNLQEPGAQLSLTSYRLTGSTKADVSLQYEDFLGWMDPWVSYLETIPIPALPLDQLKRFKGNFAATLDVGQSSPSRRSAQSPQETNSLLTTYPSQPGASLQAGRMTSP